MFQLFSTKKSRDLQPLQLNNTAKLYQEQGTSFLAFNKPVLKEVAVEYQLADDYTAKSVDQPLRITDQGNALDNTFAKKGVFALRYGDRGKDISDADTYSIDFGGKAPRALGYYENKERMVVEKGKWSSKFKENADLAQYVKDTVGADKKYDNVKPKMYERMSGVVTYDQKNTKFDGYKPLKAYEDYGYRQSDHWVKNEPFIGGLAMNVRKHEKSYVMDIDDEVCAEGSYVVNGRCIPQGRNEPHACPENWEFRPGYGCVEKQEADKPICMPGWYLNEKGMCAVKELNVGESETDSMCQYIIFAVGALLIFALFFFVYKAALKDDEVVTKSSKSRSQPG